MHQDDGRPALDGDPPQGRRALAHALLRDPSLSFRVIARRVGVSRQVVERWNARAGLRPPRPRPRTLEAWSGGRRQAARRVLGAAEVDPADVAEAMGFSRDSAEILLGTFGLAGQGAAAAGTAGSRRLRARLRAHIGRQIAALDAALTDAPQSGIDSAKVLRDLGGLKRLLDDLGPCGEGEGEPRDEPARSDAADPSPDPDELRAEIARRIARLVADGPAG